MDIKEKNLNKLLKIDDDDRRIIEMIEKNPDITQGEITKRIQKSQPTIGARIIKLEKKNLLTKRVGFNVKKVNIQLAIVHISTKDVDHIVKKIEDCPFINSAFQISGEYNLLCFIAAPDLPTIDKIVNLFFRQDPNVLSVKMNILIESFRDFVVPIDFQIEEFNKG